MPKKRAKVSARKRQHARRAAWERDILQRIGAHIRELRHAAGMTIAALAKAAEMDASYVGELERGRANLSMTGYVALALALNAPDPRVFGHGVTEAIRELSATIKAEMEAHESDRTEA